MSISHFKNNRRGNVAMMAALFMALLIGVTGAGYDFLRQSTLNNKLLSASEAAVLAGASSMDSADWNRIVNDYIDANLGDDRAQLKNLAIDVSGSVGAGANGNTRTRVTVDVTAELDTVFLSLFSINSLNLGARSVGDRSLSNVEVSLVLDVSNSMVGAKIDALRSAANDFVDEIFIQSDVSTTSMSIIPFAGSVNVGNDLFERYGPPIGGGVIDPPLTDYEDDFNAPSAVFSFPSLPTQCLEYEPSDFDENDLPLNSRSQVPFFVHPTNGTVACPLNSSEALFVSNNRRRLKNKINNMTLSHWTVMDHGALWGLKALSPSLRGFLGNNFSDRPLDFGVSNNSKNLILMTDGQITNTVRAVDPYDPSSGFIPRVRSGVEAFDATLTDTAIIRFNNICDRARANDVVVYTIGFQIAAGSIEETLLRNCATDPSKYFLVSGLDISSAFTAIAASISRLRVVG